MASQFPMARFGTTSRYTEILSDSDLNSTTYDPGRNAAYDPTKSGPPTDTFEVRQESPLRSRIGALLRPRPLNISSTRWLEFVPDFLNLLFTIAFIALGIAITRLKDQPESSWSHKVIAATQLAPTLWPILFAAVVGNAIKVFAQYRAERGATLGTLEQLMGSQTVASTVKTVYLLRAFGLYTLALLVIWAFNPLGSQASFRGVYLKDTFAMGTRLHSFQNSSMIYEAQQSALATGSGWQSSLPMVRSLYGASLFAPDAGTQYANGTSDGFQGLLLRLGGAHTVMQQMTTDVWGNVRIPDVQTLPSYTAGKKNDWVSVPNNVSVVNYTSM
jgi:hypothetical protein